MRVLGKVWRKRGEYSRSRMVCMAGVGCIKDWMSVHGSGVHKGGGGECVR